MESIGVPWFVLARQLGPPLVLLLAGGALMWWRRPPRVGLVVAALVVNLLAAALPFLWIGLQVAAGVGTGSAAGLVVLLFQPLVVFIAWMLLLAAIVARPVVRGTSP